MILNGEHAAGATPRTLAPRFLGTAADKVKWASAVLGMQEKSGVGGGRLSPRRGPGPARPGKQREGEEVGGAQSTLGSGERPASEVRGPGVLHGAPSARLQPSCCAPSVAGPPGASAAWPEARGPRGAAHSLLGSSMLWAKDLCHSTYSPAKAATTTCHRLGGFSSRK